MSRSSCTWRIGSGCSWACDRLGRSVAEVEAEGEALGEAGLADGQLGGLAVVPHAAELERAPLRVPEAVAGVGIAVAGLADAARVDQRRALDRDGPDLVVVADLLVAHREHAGQVGVAVEADAVAEDAQVRGRGVEVE